MVLGRQKLRSVWSKKRAPFVASLGATASILGTEASLADHPG
jgi:hypothetical protein